MSVRCQHCIDHANKINIQKLADLLGVVPQPTDSQLSETSTAATPVHSSQLQHCLF